MSSSSIHSYSRSSIASSSTAPVFPCSSDQSIVDASTIKTSGDQPPQAPEVPVDIGLFGEICMDSYAWMQDPQNAPAVNTYLEAWNKYSAVRYEAEGCLRVEEKLYQSLVQREKTRKDHENLETIVNQEVGDYQYYWSGDLYYRHSSATGERKIVFDNADFVKRVGSYESASNMLPSPDGTRLAFTVDFLGNECHTTFIYEIGSGVLTQVCDKTSDELAWDTQSERLFFIESEIGPHHTQRGKTCKAYLGDGEYEIIYCEESKELQLGLSTSDDGKQLILSSENYDESEVRILSLDKVEKVRVIAERKPGSLYRVAIGGERVLIWESRTDQAPHNFKLKEAPLNDCERKHWIDFGPYDPKVTDIQDVQMHKNYFALRVRQNGVSEIHTLDLKGSIVHKMDKFPESAYSLNLEPSPYDSKHVYYSYQSGIRPESTWRQDYKGLTPIEYVSGVTYENFKPEDYVSETLEVPWEGKIIPMVACYRKDCNPKDHGARPCLVNPYGDYGTNNDPWFRLPYAEWMDQGGIMVFPQVPGGAEFGQDWYHLGRKRNKINSMRALVECTLALSRKKYADPEKLALMVKSAGGILGGWIANIHPKLYQVIDIRKGWTNCLLDMIHREYPLTAVEQSDRGAPAINAQDYFCIKNYSPQENVAKQDYPAISVIAAHDDGDVPDYVAARFLAALEDQNTGRKPLLARFEKIGGHYDDNADIEDPYPGCREAARELAFMAHVIQPERPLAKIGSSLDESTPASMWNFWGLWV